MNEPGSAVYHLRRTDALVDEAYAASLGEITEEVEALETLRAMRFEEAAEALAAYVRACERTDDLVARELEALGERRDQVKRRLDWARGELRDLVTRSGQRKLNAGVFAVSLRKGSQRVDFDEGFRIEALPIEFKKLDVKANKSAIKQVLKDGGEVPHCRLVRGPESVVVK